MLFGSPFFHPESKWRVRRSCTNEIPFVAIIVGVWAGIFSCRRCVLNHSDPVSFNSFIVAAAGVRLR